MLVNGVPIDPPPTKGREEALPTKTLAFVGVAPPEFRLSVAFVKRVRPAKERVVGAPFETTLREFIPERMV